MEALEILQNEAILAYRFVKAKAEIELLEQRKGLLLEGLLIVLILYLDENQRLEQGYHRPEMLQVICGCLGNTLVEKYSAALSRHTPKLLDENTGTLAERLDPRKFLRLPEQSGDRNLLEGCGLGRKGIRQIDLIDAVHAVVKVAQPVQVESSAELLQEIFALPLVENTFRILKWGISFFVVADLVARKGTVANDRRTEDYAFEAAATRQRDIYLPGRKSHRRIDKHLVETEPLALVYGDGPGQTQRNLAEGPVHHGFYLFAFRVELVAYVFPGLHLYFNMPAFRIDDAQFRFHRLYCCQFPVVVLVGLTCVIAYEHHLCARLQRQLLLGGVGVLRKIAFDYAVIVPGLAVKQRHFPPVYRIGLGVVGAEPYPFFVVGRVESRVQPRVQTGNRFRRRPSSAHVVQQFDET